MAKRTCADPECDRDVYGRDMCKAHYDRWRTIQHANGGMPPRPLRPEFIDRTGQRWGKLTVIARVTSKPGTIWLCRCDCGSEVEVGGGDLCRKRWPTRSCGCSKPRGRKLPQGEAARNGVRNQYQQGARVRGHSWELTEDEFDRLVSQPCLYCGQPPSTTKVVESGDTFVYSGIDRMDNAIGYTPDNCVSCCKTCNYAKKAMTYDEFMAWIARLVEYQFFRPDMLPSRLLKDSRQPGVVS